MRNNFTKILKRPAAAAFMTIAMTVPAFASTGRNTSLPLQPIQGRHTAQANSATHMDHHERPMHGEWDFIDEQPIKSEFAVNDAQVGNYELMSAEEQKTVADAITAFKNTYITSDMSDVEKELMIIRWLVDGCDYEITGAGTGATAYGCIIMGKAKCAGYSDAFLQTAKACGLEARYIYNSVHAWNLVKLEGQWYHVDVTWEDPLGYNDYGFSRLRNKYINLTDSEIRSIRDHDIWYPMDAEANSKVYGQEYITQLLAVSQG